MPRIIWALLVFIAFAPSGRAEHRQAAQTPIQKWPLYDHPVFALLEPAVTLSRAGSHREAIATLDRLQPQIATASVTVQGRAMLLRGMTLRALSDLPASERAAVEARALGARAGHPFIEFDALVLQFNLANDRGTLDVAEARLAEAVPLADMTGDDLMRFNVRLEQGRLARARGKGAAALIPLNEAVAIAERIKMLRIWIQGLGSRSGAKLGLSDYDGALADSHRAFELSASPGVALDLRGAAAFSLAQTLSQIGDLERGLELWTEAIDAYTKANFQGGVSLATRQRMDVRFALGDYDGAAADGERARELFTRTGSAGQLPALLSRMALIEARRGRRDVAATYARDAAASLTSLTNVQPRVRTAVEADLASSALAQRDFADALVRFGRVLEQARALRDQDIEWRALQGQAQATLGAGDLAGAQTRFEAAVALIEKVRRTLPEAGLRADFIAERLGPYDGLIETLLQRSTRPGDAFATRAFETAERARGRALADLLAEAQARLTNPAVARIRTQEAEFGKRLSALQRSLADAKSETDRRRLADELKRAEREYDALVVRVRRDAPPYAALAHPRPSTTSDVAAGLSAQDALVSFWIGQDRGAAWIVTRSQVRSYRVPGRRDLDREVARMQSAIAGGQITEVHRIGAALYKSLLDGVDYTRVRRLIIVPDAALWRLPFAALRTDTGWLIEQASIAITPAASLLSSISAAAPSVPRRPALAFGLEMIPDGIRALRALYDDRLLPQQPLGYAGVEARDVVRLTAAPPETSLFLNNRADETSFKRVVSSAPLRVLHVASHALVDDRVPRRTALVLSPSDTDDGLLQLNEIANLQLDVDLVVLSTCQSQLGRAVRGEGLVSLSRAFIHSGARGVAASLWAVDDRETARLMPLFYAALRAGAAPDEALRQAQLQMLQAGGGSAAPSSWAAFVVMGRTNRPIFGR